MGLYDSDRNCWSGLGSRSNFAWQEGLRIVCREVGDVMFLPSTSGYAGWKDVAKSAIRRRPRRILAIGHSNGGYAITQLAKELEPHGIECVLICFDRTLKHCPALGSNVVAALDLWAGLKNLERGEDFRGDLVRRDYSHLSHIGVIGDPAAQREAIEFARRWTS